MKAERYVAAIEVGSSKIIGMVGRYEGDGQLTVLACEKIDCREFVRYGVIQNLEETSLVIARVVERLQQNVEVKPRIIEGVYVCLSGRSLRSISTSVSRNLPEETEINDEILAGLRAQARQLALDNTLEVVDLVPRAFTVNKTVTKSPKGMIGSRISVTYDVIVCRPELKRNLTRTITDKCGLRINGFVVTPIAVGHLMLSNEQKRLGCMLVDIGAETSAVSIYRDGGLCYYATLPLGGRNITRDLQSLSLLEERAENIKIDTGNAMPTKAVSDINVNGIKISDVSNIIVARSEEIVANILEQTRYAGLKEKDIPAGIICIGGGARLNGMLELMHSQSGLQVNMGMLPSFIHTEGIKISRFDLAQLACVLYEGATLSDEPCLVTPRHNALPADGEPNLTELPVEEIPDDRPHKQKGPGIFAGFKRRISNMFTNVDEDNSDLLD